MAHEMSPGTSTTSSSATSRNQASRIFRGWSFHAAPKMSMGLSYPPGKCKSPMAKMFNGPVSRRPGARLQPPPAQRTETGGEKPQRGRLVHHLKPRNPVPRLVQPGRGFGDDLHVPGRVHPPRDGEPHQLQVRTVVFARFRIAPRGDDAPLHGAHARND